MPAKSHHQKCMTFLWDEGLTIKRGAGENNMSGISEWMKESETSGGKRGWWLCWNGSLVLCNLLGGDVSSEVFHPLPVITKQAFVLLWWTGSWPLLLCSASVAKQLWPCRATACFHECSWAPGTGREALLKCTYIIKILVCEGGTARLITGLTGVNKAYPSYPVLNIKRYLEKFSWHLWIRIIFWICV